MNSIQETIFNHLPKHKKSSGGWNSFNAVCCVYNGETKDTRGRGGVITDGESISYHCFNCGYKTGWKPGRHISYKFKKLMQWMNVSESERQRLVIEALRIKETVLLEEEDHDFSIDFSPRALPENVLLLENAPSEIKEYCKSRRVSSTELLYSATKAANIDKRVIIPFTWNNKIVGYTGRAIDSKIKPKYLNNIEQNYVYGVDKQPENAKIVIVTEGVFDALSINGVAVMSNKCSEIQAQIIDILGREVILVPDRDKAGQSLIDDALKYDWSVSFPDWDNDIKDVNDAVIKYGKLFTVKTIIDAKETSKLKINLLRKRIG